MAYRLVRLSNLSDPPVNCKIVISPEKEIFEPGDKVEGILIVSHQKDIILRGFKVAVEGTSLTKFKEREIVHSKSEEFLMEYQYVFGSETQKNRLGGGGTVAKVHKFPFSLKIPLSETLPGSFKSPFGLTLYQVVAYMHMESLRFVKKAEKSIPVHGLLTLTESNLTPSVIEKSLRRSRLKLSLPQNGYLAGEEICFDVELINPNGYDIVSIVVSFIQRTTYRAGNVSRLAKTNSTLLGSTETTQVDSTAGIGTIWTNRLRIPTKQSPTQQNGIIEIQYILKAEVNSNGEIAGLHAECPIIIGTARSNTRSPTRATVLSDDNSEKTSAVVMKKERPPTYSALSLKNSGSMSKSPETLPPEYEDIECEIKNLDSLVI